MADTELQELLLAADTDVYFIEYRQFFSNHVAHGIIALRCLGADREYIQRFIVNYAKKLEPVGSDIISGSVASSNEGVLGEATLTKLKGHRTDFYALRRHFEALLKRHGSISELIRREYPKNADGMVCSALHGLIQLGYACSSGMDFLVCEGLAYLHHSAVPLVHDENDPRNDLRRFGQGHESLLDLIKEVYADEDFLTFMKKEAELGRALWVSSYYQYRVWALMRKRGDYLIQLANRCQLPGAVNAEEVTADEIKRLADWLIDTAIFVYAACARVNDFFLLHGATGAWSLKQILLHLSPKDALVSLRLFICVLIVTVAAQDCPPIREDFDVSDLPEPTNATWDEIKREALANETRDEHIYKLVQVCYDMWTQDKTKAKLYVKASRISMGNPLAFPTAT